MSKLNPSIKVTLSHDEVMSALIKAIKEKHPSIAEDEFEIVFVYQPYDHTLSVVVDAISND